MPSEAISDIISNLEFVAAAKESGVSSLADIALSGVRASSSRAQIDRARLGAMARLTVAATGVAPLNSYLAGGIRSEELDEAFRNVIRAALALASNIPVRHTATDEMQDLPGEWNEVPSGYFTREVENIGTFAISHDPHLPNGDWSLSLSGIPVLYAKTSAELADKTDELIGLIEPANPDLTTSGGNPFRRH